MSATTGPSGLEIAVIGMSCHVPGARTVDGFWRNLRGGVESISFWSEDELRGAGVARHVLAHPGHVRAGGVLDDIARFDASFFGYTPREAEVMDPQPRLFLERASEALERAGYDAQTYSGAIGVYAGMSSSTYLFGLLAHPDLRVMLSGFQMGVATDKDYLASRIAYKLGFQGPAVSVQTACSTSLVAVHLACQSLLAGECDMALAGGVSIRLPEKGGYLHEEGGILSRDGHTRAFDAAASGTVPGNGLGIVVLKRLADALRDGDRIAAVVKGSAMNNDGARKIGFTAPGVEGQTAVVRNSLAMAGVAADTIGYVEAHGTGTSLGDPIEVAALTQAFREQTTRRRFCGLGSVKTNIGHLDPAAGIAGFIKAVLMLEHRELVPSLHFERPNPKIDFEASPFYVTTETRPWDASDGPRRAGVSSFGIGGTNVHVVLEEAPAPLPAPPAAGPYVLVLSAKTSDALERATDGLAGHLSANMEAPLADVAFTLRRGRRAFLHRRAVLCESAAEGGERLRARDGRTSWSGVAEEAARPVALMFPGQGAQHVDMAGGLYASQPVFRREVDACCERLRPALGLDLRSVLYPSESEAAAAEALGETRMTQPALFVVEYALARLWTSFGLVPESLIGHSVGEYVAACLAGVMTRDDALALVAERGRLMQQCPRGAMVAIALSAEAVRPLLEGALGLCADNGPEACVAGGTVEEIARLEARLRAQGVTHARLATSHAFHCALMDPAVEAFRARVAQVPLAPPRVPFLSNVTGTWITPGQATDPGYWARHLRETVRFGDGLRELMSDPRRVLLEAGPGHTLVSLARKRVTPGSGQLALPSLPNPRRPEPDDAFLLATAARLWVAGLDVDWSGEARARKGRRTVLPTYPFAGERYWIDPTATVAAPRAPAADGLHIPSWRRTQPAAAHPRPGSAACVFVDEGGLGDAIVERLRADGVDVAVVRPGDRFAHDGSRFVVSPGSGVDHERLVRDLASREPAPDRFIHLWGVGPSPSSEGAAWDLVFSSVRHLAAALERAPGPPTRLLIASTDAQDVTGEEEIDPVKAAAVGIALATRSATLACRHVDLSFGPGGSSVSPAEAILFEAAADEAPVVAYRGRHRWRRDFEPVPAPPAMTSRLRRGGTYLITGGLGRLGLALAGGLARAFAARLVLTGRVALLEERAEWDAALGGPLGDRVRAVREIESHGSEVLILRADVGETTAMRTVVERTLERFGALHGVFHAAWAGGDDDIAPGPSVQGTRVLAEALAGLPLDFVVLMSSLAGIVPEAGEAARAAADQFLEAFARRQHRRGQTHWAKMAWDRKHPRGATEMAESLARVLSLDRAVSVIVSAGDLDVRLRSWAAGPRLTPADAAAPIALHVRPILPTAYTAPENATEQQLAELWGSLLGIEKVGLDDNFFELGGDSVTALRAIALLKERFGCELPVVRFYEAPTVALLARAIGAQARQEAPAALGGVEERAETRRDRMQQRRDTRGPRPPMHGAPSPWPEPALAKHTPKEDA